MTIITPYEIGSIVYLITDPDQRERMIIGIYVCAHGLTYELRHESATSWHYDFEFTKEKDLVKATTN